jgi:hypothetical protein
MNISNYISESLETIRWVNIPKFFYADPDLGSKIFLTLNPRFGMEKFGCGKNIPDPQHWKKDHGASAFLFILLCTLLILEAKPDFYAWPNLINHEEKNGSQPNSEMQLLSWMTLKYRKKERHVSCGTYCPLL